MLREWQIGSQGQSLRKTAHAYIGRLRGGCPPVSLTDRSPDGTGDQMKQQTPALAVVEPRPDCATLDFCRSISSGLMEDVGGPIRKLPRSRQVLAFLPW